MYRILTIEVIKRQSTYDFSELFMRLQKMHHISVALLASNVKGRRTVFSSYADLDICAAEEMTNDLNMAPITSHMEWCPSALTTGG